MEQRASCSEFALSSLPPSVSVEGSVCDSCLFVTTRQAPLRQQGVGVVDSAGVLRFSFEGASLRPLGLHVRMAGGDDPESSPRIRQAIAMIDDMYEDWPSLCIFLSLEVDPSIYFARVPLSSDSDKSFLLYRTVAIEEPVSRFALNESGCSLLVGGRNGSLSRFTLSGAFQGDGGTALVANCTVTSKRCGEPHSRKTFSRSVKSITLCEEALVFVLLDRPSLPHRRSEGEAEIHVLSPSLSPLFSVTTLSCGAPTALSWTSVAYGQVVIAVGTERGALLFWKIAFTQPKGTDADVNLRMDFLHDRYVSDYPIRFCYISGASGDAADNAFSALVLSQDGTLVVCRSDGDPLEVLNRQLNTEHRPSKIKSTARSLAHMEETRRSELHGEILACSQSGKEILLGMSSGDVLTVTVDELLGSASLSPSKQENSARCPLPNESGRNRSSAENADKKHLSHIPLSSESIRYEEELDALDDETPTVRDSVLRHPNSYFTSKAMPRRPPVPIAESKEPLQALPETNFSQNTETAENPQQRMVSTCENKDSIQRQSVISSSSAVDSRAKLKDMTKHSCGATKKTAYFGDPIQAPPEIFKEIFRGPNDKQRDDSSKHYNSSLLIEDKIAQAQRQKVNPTKLDIDEKTSKVIASQIVNVPKEEALYAGLVNLNSELSATTTGSAPRAPRVIDERYREGLRHEPHIDDMLHLVRPKEYSFASFGRKLERDGFLRHVRYTNIADMLSRREMSSF